MIKEKLKKTILNKYNSELAKHEQEIVNSVLKDEDFNPVVNKRPDKVHRIAFFLGAILPFSGGVTSMLRLGTGLVQRGYDVTYVSFQNQDISEMEQIAKKNLSGAQGTFQKISTVPDDFDIVIATSWQSVYHAKRFKGYKMYFVQDYEPFFFKLNERYLLAEMTYKLGFHIVSLGEWNLAKIHQYCGDVKGILDFITFPYEPGEYTMTARNYDIQKRTYKIAVYSKEEGKRLPNLLQVLLQKTAQELKKRGIDIEILFFGFSPNIKTQIGKNLGKLTKTQLLNLYKTVDFGMCASMTNISLVPFEMIATGLPVIEFENGSFPFFFPADSAILTDFNAHTLAEKLEDFIKHPQKIKDMMKIAHTHIRRLSWDNSIEEFDEILMHIKEGVSYG